MLHPTRAILAATLALAAAIPVASASADTTLNIVPHGNQAPGVPWATAPGVLPADTQAKMYDRITPLFRNVTDDVLKPSTDGSGYYKSAALLPESDPSFVTSETVGGTSPTAGAVSARIKRDNYGVPHIYADTDAGAIFGAGYAVATDQSLLLNQARYNGIAGLIDMPGVPAINLVLGLYNYAPSKKVVAEATALQTKAIEAQGAQGKQLLNDIDTYLAGINARMQVAQPTLPRFTRTDIYALNAIKSQFLGEGGGQEVDNALFLDGLRSKLGAKTGDKAFADLRARNDVEASATTSKSFPGQGSVSVSKPSGMVRLKKRDVQELVHQAAGREGRVGERRLGGQAPAGEQHPDRVGREVGDRQAAVRRRPADRVQLPRADDGDAADEPVDQRRGRDVRAVPGLHADRPRRRLRVVADLGRRRHHRHLRREALRRLEDQVLLQGQVPEDGEGRRPARSPRPAAAARRRPSSTARSTARSSATPRTRRRASRSRCHASAPPTGARPSTSCSTSR